MKKLRQKKKFKLMVNRILKKLSNPDKHGKFYKNGGNNSIVFEVVFLQNIKNTGLTENE